MTQNPHRRVALSTIPALALGALWLTGISGCRVSDEPDLAAIARGAPDSRLPSAVTGRHGGPAGERNRPGADTAPIGSAVAPELRQPSQSEIIAWLGDLSLPRALVIALHRNRSLRIERLSPALFDLARAEQRAVFDPVFGAELTRSHDKRTIQARFGSGTESLQSDVDAGTLSIETFLPTGTTVRASLESRIVDSSLYRDEFVSSRAGLTLTQSLLQGNSMAANLARLEQAKLDIELSRYELRGFLLAFLARLETLYWDLSLAEARIRIFRESLELAKQQLDDTQAKVNAGRWAKTELPAARAELSLREQDLIDATSRRDRLRLELLSLLQPPGARPFSAELKLKEEPFIPRLRLAPVDEHVKLALKRRPELNQSRLEVKRGELEIVRTKNGILPRLDAFANLGKTGFATRFEQAAENLVDRTTLDWTLGLRFEMPAGRRAAKAARRRAFLNKRALVEAVGNLAMLIEFEVRAAYVEVERSQRQIVASAATRSHREENVRAEQARLDAGRSTAFLVAQAQRDLVQSRIAEVEAAASMLRALIELYRAEGTLLERRYLKAPGAETVDPVEDSRTYAERGEEEGS